MTGVLLNISLQGESEELKQQLELTVGQFPELITFNIWPSILVVKYCNFNVSFSSLREICDSLTHCTTHVPSHT
jgi:hypothetical protein